MYCMKLNDALSAIWIRYPKTASTTIKYLFLQAFKYTNNIDDSETYVERCGDISLYYDSKFDIFKTKKYKLTVLRSLKLNEFVELYPSIWNNLYKIVSCRNPYDRFVSGYNYLNVDIPFNEMDKFDYNSLKQEYILNHIIRPIYSDIIKEVDYIIRFEYLHEDLKELFNILNLELDLTNIPIFRKTSYISYKEYYKNAPNMIDFVYNTFKSDFDFFGYDKNINFD